MAAWVAKPRWGGLGERVPGSLSEAVAGVGSSATRWRCVRCSAAGAGARAGAGPVRYEVGIAGSFGVGVEAPG